MHIFCVSSNKPDPLLSWEMIMEVVLIMSALVGLGLLAYLFYMLFRGENR